MKKLGPLDKLLLAFVLTITVALIIFSCSKQTTKAKESHPKERLYKVTLIRNGKAIDAAISR